MARKRRQTTRITEHSVHDAAMPRRSFACCTTGLIFCSWFWLSPAAEIRDGKLSLELKPFTWWRVQIPKEPPGSVTPAVPKSSGSERKGSPAELSPPSVIPKPRDNVLERRAHAQPAAPADAKEIPYIETAPEPALTDAEKQRGYLLFARPTVEPVYPNTRPRPDERLDALVAFAAPGQFEPVTLALYPVRPLVNLKVRVSSLACSAGEIPADCVDVRLGTYWNVGYPPYTTVKTYRRTPELLERVTVHSSPAGECQRYWLTIHVPDDARPGLYLGTVTVWDDGFDRALSIPIALRVLGFRLQKDPAKHYSAYFYTRNKTLYQGRSEAFIRKAADNDYRAMADFGLDMLPTLYLSCEDGKRIVVRDADEIPRMLRAGLQGPAPVTADGVIQQVYRDTTPGGKVESHWRVEPAAAAGVLRAHHRVVPGFGGPAQGQGLAGVHLLPDRRGRSLVQGIWREGLRGRQGRRAEDLRDQRPRRARCRRLCPLPRHLVLPAVLRAVRADRRPETVRVLVLPEPQCGRDQGPPDDVQRRPDDLRLRLLAERLHHADPLALVLDVRTGPVRLSARDVIRVAGSGWTTTARSFRRCIGPASARVMTMPATSIRSSRRSSSGKIPPTRPARQRFAQARRILQETWDAIRVQPKYLAAGMWPSEEFDAIRWRLAAQTQRLLQYPATNKATAPSVLIGHHRRRPGQGTGAFAVRAGGQGGKARGLRPGRRLSLLGQRHRGRQDRDHRRRPARGQDGTPLDGHGRLGARWRGRRQVPDRLAADQPEFQARRT